MQTDSPSISNNSSSTARSIASPTVRKCRAVANGRVGRVLARPIFAPEETTPKKLTFAIVLSFAKMTDVYSFFGILLSFLRTNEADVRYTVIDRETFRVKIINERVVTS